MTVPIDEREGKPSASGIERLTLCPGSWLAEQGLPDEKSDVAERGDRIHLWLAKEAAGDPVPELPDDELELALRCQEQRLELGRSLFGTADSISIERRFRVLDDYGNTVATGQADFVSFTGKRALIVDYKTGRGEVTESPRNPQLMTLAVAVDDETMWNAEEIIVAIIQPDASTKPLCASYDRAALSAARETVLRAVNDAMTPHAPRVPGEKQCKYCRAKAHCPAAHENIKTLAVTTIQPAEMVTSEEIAALLDRCGAAEKVIGAIRAEAKRRLTEGQVVPGWKLKPGVEREKIVNVNGVFANMVAKGATAEEFAGICSVTKTELKALLKAKTGAKGKALDAELDAVLAGMCEVKITAPSLVRE